MSLADYLKTLTDMRLVKLLKEARRVEDKELKNLILIELGRRETEKK